MMSAADRFGISCYYRPNINGAASNDGGRTVVVLVITWDDMDELRCYEQKSQLVMHR